MQHWPSAALVALSCAGAVLAQAEELRDAFRDPPPSARPGVYWYFMDGNQDRDEMVADLESMARVGIGTVLLLEVDIGVPQGPVAFMSETWQDNFVHAVHTADRLGMEVILGTGPGWTGSGGSWVTAEDSMQHLVGEPIQVSGPRHLSQALPVPAPHPPNHFAGLSEPLAERRDAWYQDVAVLAFPTPAEGAASCPESVFKTLRDVGPYSIHKDEPLFVRMSAQHPEPSAARVIDPLRILDLSSNMKPGDVLDWEVPAGDWTVMRFVARSTGQTTRPAPRAGHGFEHDKMAALAFRRHWSSFQARLLERIGPRREGRGLTTIHLDSWEMSSQNWTAAFREEFTERRGYDPQPFYPAWMGLLVGSLEQTERFLWDLRRTAQELVLDEYAKTILDLAHEDGLLYSNEPYDMNPAGDIDLGSIADIPACEFWNARGGPDTQYSCIEATSIAHVMGRSQVNAEAFTTAGFAYADSPASLKNQTDWALALGINGFIFHTFQHQATGGEQRPGMSMGPYGVQWNRNETWWELTPGYHEYLTRCSHVLRQGRAVADILYLTPEGAPMIFAAPQSALTGAPRLRDKRGYNFDAVTPRLLGERARVQDGSIEFAGGSSYRVLVLPRIDTMTPETLETITRLVRAGATVLGDPPTKSPSLEDHPACDARVRALAQTLWGSPVEADRNVGEGRVLRWSQGGTESLLPGAAQWIWQDQGSPAVSAPVGPVRFRTTFEIADPGSVATAWIEATADNEFRLQIDGQEILAGDDFHQVHRSDIARHLREGENTITAVAVNVGTGPNPAGFLAALQVVHADGTRQRVVTGAGWQASTDAKSWAPAKTLGPGDMGPWDLRTDSAAAAQSLYPEYDAVAGALAAMGIPEDFRCDGPIRYGHRRTTGADLYFVANTTDQRVDANCSFRAVGAPELWDPVSREVRSLPDFASDGGITSVPVTFEPHQSFFVVFGLEGSGTSGQGQANFTVNQPVQELEGAWEVSFAPEWGGPEHVTFETLHDWTTNADDGIRYYSGTAIYRKSFDLPAHTSPVFLDLGAVHEICRVRLNGRDLGILWTPPWRVDISDVVQVADNRLEIEVVNNWVNRLIGDQQPADRAARTVSFPDGLLAGAEFRAGRYTFCTRDFYDRASPLMPSGLLGPVRIGVGVPPAKRRRD